MHPDKPRLNRILAPGFAVVAGLGLRIFASLTIGFPTFDTGTPAAMALHILRYGERPLFFYGQDYMGALEAYVAAGFMMLFGPTFFAASLSPILFSAGWIVASGLLFRELFGSRGGIAAMWVVAVPGTQLLWYSISTYGGYPAALMFGTLALWLCVRMVRRLTPDHELWWEFPLLGAMAGLGLWTHYLSAVYLITGGLLLLPWLLRHRTCSRLWASAAVGSLMFAFTVSPVVMAYRGERPDAPIKMDVEWSHLKISWAAARDRALPSLLDRGCMELPQHLSRSILAGMLLIPLVLILAGGWRHASRQSRISRILTPLFLALFLVALAQLSRIGTPSFLLYSLLGVCLLGLAEFLWRSRLFEAVPLLFLGVFAILYLPHPLAYLGAPRYLFPAWAVLLCGGFAAATGFARPLVSRIGWGFLALWVGMGLVGFGFTCRSGAERKQTLTSARAELIETAAERAIVGAFLDGGPIFGHLGQTYTFLSQGKTRFVSVWDERHLPSLQKVAAHPAALIYSPPVQPRANEMLEDLHLHPWQHYQNRSFFMVHDLKPIHLPRRTLVPETLQVRTVRGDIKSGSALTDENAFTTVTWELDDPLIIRLDFGRPRPLCGFWFFNRERRGHGLPTGYRLAVSDDGISYQTVREVENRLLGYRCGNQVYSNGYFVKTESRFPPVTARYVELTLTRVPRNSTRGVLSKLVLFEALDGEEEIDPLRDLEPMADAIRQHHLTFVVADRWLSARLLDRIPTESDSSPIAYPQFNPRYPETIISRQIQPRPGLAVAVDRAITEEMVSLINSHFGEDTLLHRIDFSAYSLLILDKPEWEDAPPLYWNGFILVYHPEPESREWTEW